MLDISESLCQTASQPQPGTDVQTWILYLPGFVQTLAVEVLWTPQDEDDYYTRDEIFQDYPTLNNL